LCYHSRPRNANHHQLLSWSINLEQWVELDEFPNYEVSDLGRVRNKTTRQILKPLDNRRGALMVVLRRDGGNYSRAVRRLVAMTFDPVGDRSDLSPIHLDCDYRNCAADNLEWRPRWMAYEWTRQNQREPRSLRSIEDIDTGDFWESSWHAARDFGTTEGIIYSTANATNQFGEYVGKYKGRRLRFRDGM